MSQADVPAAQYVRMSTDHQQYSIDNQACAIGLYAAAYGFRIVRSYTDYGVSGVGLKHRSGLRQLLEEVVRVQVEYKAILVYDVRRWGRFQDSDESAHYEYLCKSAGIPVYSSTTALWKKGRGLATAVTEKQFVQSAAAGI